MKTRICFYALISYILSGLLAYSVLFFLFAEKTKPLVSVILPTYNRVDLLPLAIESVLNQRFHNFELIIVDDGSTDNSIALIQSYMKKDKRISLIVNSENKGISYSRNRAYRQAQGKYIMPMDSDDQILPDKLYIQTAFLEAHSDIDLVSSCSQKTDGGYNYCANRFTLNVELLLGNPFGHIETLIRKSFLDKNHILYNESFMAAVDYDLYAQMFMKGARFAMLPQILSRIRRHHTNPQEYYVAQKQNHLKIKEKLFNFFNIPYTANENNCLILKYLQTRSSPAKELPLSQIQGIYQWLCFSHAACRSPDARDYILNENGKETLIRFMPDATICNSWKPIGKGILSNKNQLTIHLNNNKLTQYLCEKHICKENKK